MNKVLVLILSLMATSAMAEEIFVLIDSKGNKYDLIFKYPKDTEDRAQVFLEEKGTNDYYILDKECNAFTPEVGAIGQWGVKGNEFWITNPKGTMIMTFDRKYNPKIAINLLGEVGRESCTNIKIINAKCRIELFGMNLLTSDNCLMAILEKEIRIVDREYLIATINLEKDDGTDDEVTALIEPTSFNEIVKQDEMSLVLEKLNYNRGCWENSAGKVCAWEKP